MLRLAGEHPLQLLELAALDVLELESDTLGRLGLLVVDLILKLPLAPAEPLGDLVQGAPALGAVGLELGREGGRHILGGAVEVLAHLGDPVPVLLERALELRGRGVDLRLDRRRRAAAGAARSARARR